ncbi:hypothetical protein ACRBEV_27345 [Methylobacterium phyllosphaerae]
MNQDPNARRSAAGSDTRPLDASRDGDARRREAVVAAWRRALRRMRDRRAGQDQAGPGG